MTPSMISACEAHVIDIMGDGYPDIPVIVSGQAVPDVSIYVRFWVVPSEDVFPVALGTEADSRNVGLLQASVYGPKDRGAGETGDIAFYIAKKLHRKSIEAAPEGWVTLKDAGVKDMGDMGEEHLQVVRAPYRYDFKFPE